MSIRSTRQLLAAAGLSALVLPVFVQADTIMHDGTTDTTWSGANWTINAGPAGSVVPPTSGPSGNVIDLGYDGHDWTIDNGTISENLQVKLDGGSLTISNSSVSLLPAGPLTGANLSGLNLGQNGNATTSTVTNSTLNVSRSNQNGNALRLRNASSMDLIGSTVFVDSQLGSGNLTVEAGSALSVDATSQVNVTGGIELNNPASSVTINGGTVNAGWLRGNSGANSPQDLMFDFSSGSIVLSNSNPLRDNSAFEGQFNFTGAAGSATITHTDLSVNDNNIAGKLAQGFFSIDGTAINPTLTNTTDWTNPANIALLNDELDDLVVGGRFLALTSDGSEQVLSIVPEPGSLALMGLGVLMIARRRRG